MTSSRSRSTLISEDFGACLVLFGLWGLAVAQPLLDLLGNTAAFFVAHRADSTDLVLFALVVSLAAPVFLGGLLFLLRRLDSWRPWVSRVEAAISGLLVALIAARWMSGWPVPSWIVVLPVLSAGAVAAIALHRWPPARTLTRWLGAVAWVFPLLFLLVSPVRKIGADPDAKAATSSSSAALRPVTAVLVVLDEFPLVSLLDDVEQIDGGRYPHFAALAETATWYRSATTVAQSTAYAVPAILSGRSPGDRKSLLPVWADYRKNLFTALRRGANLHVVETMTRLCPSRLCSGQAHLVPRGLRLRGMLKDAAAVYLHQVAPAGWSGRLPVIGETWRDFWTPPADADEVERNKSYKQDVEAVFDRFIEDLSAFPAPALHYVHLMAPHLPWNRLPDGTTYGTRQRMPHGLKNQSWRGSEWETLQAQQRHLLQVGWVDTLLGRLRAELEDLGLWQDTILVITSDHGTAFETGGRRRNLSPANFAEIVNVPLFIKYPGQVQGSIDDSNAETVDIMPTLLTAMGAQIPRRVRGLNLASEKRRATKTVHYSGLQGSSAGKGQVFDLDRLLERRRALALKIRRFGTGNWETVYAAGAFGDLVGRSVGDLRGADKASTGPLARLDNPADFDLVDLDLKRLPLQVRGSLRRDIEAEPLSLAVAVNGVVQATTETFLDNKRWRFTALLPKAALINGSNTVEILRIVGQPGDPAVRRLKRRTPHSGDAEGPA